MSCVWVCWISVWPLSYEILSLDGKKRRSIYSGQARVPLEQLEVAPGALRNSISPCGRWRQHIRNTVVAMSCPAVRVLKTPRELAGGDTLLKNGNRLCIVGCGVINAVCRTLTESRSRHGKGGGEGWKCCTGSRKFY